MATSTISQLTSGSIPLSGSELIEIEQAGNTRKISALNTARTLLLQGNEFTKNQNLDSSTLSIVASAVDISFLNNGNCKLTLTEDVTVNQATDLVDGRTVMLKVTQDGTGNRTLSFHSSYDFANHPFEVIAPSGSITWYNFWTDGTSVYARKIWEDN